MNMSKLTGTGILERVAAHGKILELWPYYGVEVAALELSDEQREQAGKRMGEIAEIMIAVADRIDGSLEQYLLDHEAPRSD